MRLSPLCTFVQSSIPSPGCALFKALTLEDLKGLLSCRTKGRGNKCYSEEHTCCMCINLWFCFVQACSRGPSLRAAQPFPAGQSTTDLWPTPRFWPRRWAAPWGTWQSWWTVCGGRVSGSWWTKTFSPPATTSLSGPWWTGTWCRTTQRSSCSRLTMTC